MSGPLYCNRSFAGLAGAQFLEAANDNMFKMVVSLFSVGMLADPHGGSYLSLTGILFSVPYLLFSGYAGQLADVLPKRSVMIGCKVAEIAITLGGALALAYSSSIAGLMVILFLLASHSAFFSPSKYGSVPEIVAPQQLMRANGILESSRYAALVLGSITGGLLMQMWRTTPVRIGWAMVAIAGLGLLSSTLIKPVAPAQTVAAEFNSPWANLIEGTRRIFRSRQLTEAVASLTFFDILAALTLMDVLLLARTEFGMGDAAAGTLAAFAAIGTLTGALLCGHIAGNTTASGIVPVAGMGIAATLGAIAFASKGYWSLGELLFVLGIFGGLFIVPCISCLQKIAGGGERGLIISTANFIDMMGVLLASAVLAVLHGVLLLSPRSILAIAGLAAIAYVVWLLRWRTRPYSQISATATSITHQEVSHARG